MGWPAPPWSCAQTLDGFAATLETPDKNQLDTRVRQFASLAQRSKLRLIPRPAIHEEPVQTGVRSLRVALACEPGATPSKWGWTRPRLTVG